MVQEARLDLIGRLAVVGLALGLAAGARAQPLLPDAPLTTLMRPQPLDRSRPLLPQPGVAAPRQPGQAAGSPCERPAAGDHAAGAGPAPARAAYGGSGPGEYARFMPGAPSPLPAPPSSSPSSSLPTSTGPSGSPSSPLARGPGADRPLVGGTDRPLWSTGEARAKPPVAAKPGASADARGTADARAAADAGGLPSSALDRPLWADASPAASSGTRETGAAGGLPPCTGGTPLAR